MRIIILKSEVIIFAIAHYDRAFQLCTGALCGYYEGQTGKSGTNMERRKEEGSSVHLVLNGRPQEQT